MEFVLRTRRGAAMSVVLNFRKLCDRPHVSVTLATLSRKIHKVGFEVVCVWIDGFLVLVASLLCAALRPVVLALLLELLLLLRLDGLHQVTPCKGIRHC